MTRRRLAIRVRRTKCRCWAEPYYGNPAVPDASLPLQRSLRTSATGREPWTSIETLIRPDGTVAETLVQGRDGTRFHSTFAGSHVTREVTLPDGQKVTVETRDGVQTIYAGEARTPVLQTVWTARGRRSACRAREWPTRESSPFRPRSS